MFIGWSGVEQVGLAAKAAMAAGELVTDEIVIGIIRDRCAAVLCTR